jgi:AGZA family xanthine/uracil permease-like MFS transporter
MDRGAVMTATILSAIFATLLMAFYAKLPFAMASCMGFNSSLPLQ